MRVELWGEGRGEKKSLSDEDVLKIWKRVMRRGGREDGVVVGWALRNGMNRGPRLASFYTLGDGRLSFPGNQSHSCLQLPSHQSQPPFHLVKVSNFHQGVLVVKEFDSSKFEAPPCI